MNLEKQVREAFKKDVAEHEVTVHVSAGCFRHVEVGKPGTGVDRYALTTWPGHLAISGDRGTYVFRRTMDMFTFFRPAEGESRLINPGYWGEKLEAIDRRNGFKKFCVETFIESVTDLFDMSRPDFSSDAMANEAWNEIQDTVITPAKEDGEHAAYLAVQSFEHGGFRFEDFFDAGGTEAFTYGYLWALHAIVWGIHLFDQQAAT